MLGTIIIEFSRNRLRIVVDIIYNIRRVEVKDKKINNALALERDKKEDNNKKEEYTKLVIAIEIVEREFNCIDV